MLAAVAVEHLVVQVVLEAQVVLAVDKKAILGLM
jgi:hypothetical protein